VWTVHSWPSPKVNCMSYRIEPSARPKDTKGKGVQPMFGWRQAICAFLIFTT
jgi:hypothetical protein